MQETPTSESSQDIIPSADRSQQQCPQITLAYIEGSSTVSWKVKTGASQNSKRNPPILLYFTSSILNLPLGTSSYPEEGGGQHLQYKCGDLELPRTQQMPCCPSVPLKFWTQP